jgi:ribosomal protein S1
LQSNSKTKNLDYLNLISKDLNAKNLVKIFRFSFSSKTHRTSSLLKEHTKAKNLKTKTETFKNYLLFIHNLYKNSKRYPMAIVKKIKGGFMVRSLGINTFMPRSHRLKKKNAKTQQILLQFKAWRRKKKYHSKKNWKFKVNLVSSMKKAQKSLFESSKN